jgi:hypothetical protein
MQAVVDTVADKGIFHKNKAARDKSRLSTKVKALATATPEGGLTPQAHRTGRRLPGNQQPAVCNGCAVSKAEKPPKGGFFCFWAGFTALLGQDLLGHFLTRWIELS